MRSCPFRVLAPVRRAGRDPEAADGGQGPGSRLRHARAAGTLVQGRLGHCALHALCWPAALQGGVAACANCHPFSTRPSAVPHALPPLLTTPFCPPHATPAGQAAHRAGGADGAGGAGPSLGAGEGWRGQGQQRGGGGAAGAGGADCQAGGGRQGVLCGWDRGLRHCLPVMQYCYCTGLVPVLSSLPPRPLPPHPAPLPAPAPIAPGPAPARARAPALAPQVYSECPSFDEMIPALLAHPIEELPQRVHFKPGVPIKPMLAKPTTGEGWEGRMAAARAGRGKAVQAWPATQGLVWLIPSAQPARHGIFACAP